MTLLKVILHIGSNTTLSYTLETPKAALSLDMSKPGCTRFGHNVYIYVDLLDYFVPQGVVTGTRISAGEYGPTHLSHSFGEALHGDVQ